MDNKQVFVAKLRPWRPQLLVNIITISIHCNNYVPSSEISLLQHFLASVMNDVRSLDTTHFFRSGKLQAFARSNRYRWLNCMCDSRIIMRMKSRHKSRKLDSMRKSTLQNTDDVTNRQKNISDVHVLNNRPDLFSRTAVELHNICFTLHHSRSVERTKVSARGDHDTSMSWDFLSTKLDGKVTKFSLFSLFVEFP